jgi:cell surface protein SprA
MMVFFTFEDAFAQTPNLPFPILNPLNPFQNLPQSFDLGDPTNLNQTIVYDPESKTFVFRDIMGKDTYFRAPQAMTLEEYLQYEEKKSFSLDWQELVAEESAENRTFELPIKIGSKAFQSFFGSDEITITPGGNLEISLGANHSRVDNPILPMRQRNITRFDFNQNINMDITGQIGTNMKVNMKYNTRANFDFENISKLERTGQEDDILQKIALGQVSLELPTTLIPSSQTLFGFKTQLKFGRSTVDFILAQSKGKRTEINVTGKAQVQKFEITADNYEANRHYFLNLYHQQHYDTAMATLPVVNSTTYITRIEVWVTNRSSITENTRNIVAFSDLGEAKQANCQGNPGNYSTQEIPDNQANGLYDWAAAQPLVRGFSNAVLALSAQVNSPGPFNQAVDYEKVENARKLNDNEFTYNALLGYVSLNTALNNDEVLAVAYEYTYRGQTYQIGEFSTDGTNGQDALILKLIKPTITSPTIKIWDLMMKNVYSIGAYQVDQLGFKIDVYYNNRETSVLQPFLPFEQGDINKKQIVTLLDMDKINQNNQPFSDGVFDFAPFNVVGNKIDNGGTINRKNGRIFFTTVEPFGKTLADKLSAAGVPSVFINQLAYTELYDSTKTAAQQIPSKNRFVFKGEFQSSISSEIPLNVMNIPQGAVVVTAGGMRLVEGVDFTVDYAFSRVKILNTGILESNTPIKISIESNSVFGFQARSMIGGRYQYRINENFKVGATWLRMMERPVTQKVDFGSEPFKNNVLGADFAFRTNVPLLTKLVDLLPVISTNTMSTLSMSGEVATLRPGQPRAINREGTSYIDDFEASQSAIDLKNISAWRLASVPQGQPDLFPEAAKKDLSAGFKRANLAWYTIDPVFYQSNQLTPAHIRQDPSMLYDSRMRLIQMTDIFPNLQLQYGSISNINVLDLAYYPAERGMYNFDTTATVDSVGRFTNPEERWGGIMRGLSTNDFELANIEFIQFWLLDPFNEDAENQNPNAPMSGGDLYFNLGNVSEDILPDSRKSFEHGLPSNSDPLLQDNIDTTQWARISTQQVVVNAFANDPASRIKQDVGLDGWDNADERQSYAAFVSWVQNNTTLSAAAKARMIADPSTDDYNYYLDDNYDAAQLTILDRYKRYNGMQGNSPTTEMSDTANTLGYPTIASNFPDIEDINQDNNLSESEAYFQYRVSLRPGDMQNVGSNFITNKQIYQNGNKTETWYQFKVPIRDFEKRINGIQDFRSIRFMRMYMKGFDEPVVLRFARLEFVRGEWRRYFEDLTQPGLSVQTDPNLTSFNIAALNIEENAQRQPINYVVPPGIDREIDPSQVYQRQMNEQALVLEVCNLQDGDARAAYRNVQFDVRTYKKLKMFAHAESVVQNQLKDNELTLFVRLGTDFVENYYEYELPLKVTDWNVTNPDLIWPAANNIEIEFDRLLDLKMERNTKLEQGVPGVSSVVEYEKADPNNAANRIKVKGSPNLQGIRTIMIGVRNPSKADPDNTWGPDKGDAECTNVWVNEMRLTDFVSDGGSAAVGQMQVQLADFAVVQAAGNYSGINWGAVDSRVQDRQRNQRMGADISTTMQLGQFFGKQARVSLPFYYGYSIGVINPEYDPFNPDIKLSNYDIATRKERMRLGQDFTERRSYNFTNVRKEAKAGTKPQFWSISNWSATYAFAENIRRDFNIKSDMTRTWTGALNYNYTFAGKPWEPFKKWQPAQKNPWLKPLKDFNLFYLPKNIAFTNDYSRIYNERQIRNIIVPEFDFEPIYLKRFDWNRTYQVGYDVTKALKTTFTANNRSIFEEGNHAVDRRSNPEGYQEFMDTLRSQMNTFGRTMDYTHNYSISYTLPFDKLPVTSWLSSNVRYSGTYNWQRAPLGQAEFGNTIQNTRAINMTAQGNLVTLYNKIPYFKRVLSDGKGMKTNSAKTGAGGQPGKGAPPKKAEFKPKKPLEEMTDKERKEYDRQLARFERKQAREEALKAKETEPINPVMGTLARMVMSVRNISGTYTLSDGTMLPGYSQESSLLGMNGSSFGLTPFVFGKQGYDVFGRENGYHVGDFARDNNWLVQNENINRQFMVNHTANLQLKATLEPLKDLNINLNASRNYSTQAGEFYRWNPSSNAFEGQSRFETSTLTYTTISWGTAFAKMDSSFRSPIFQQMINNSQQVSQLIGANNSNSSSLPNGYYEGYSATQQEVVIGSFLTAYTNSPIDNKTINPRSNLPLPNWTINYAGLSKFAFAKDVVKSFKLNHGYSSSVSVNGMQTNLNATLDANGSPTALDLNNNFISAMQVQNITISERFSPLIGMLATWKIAGKNITTNFEYKKDRQATLSLNNNQVTETLGQEIVVGTVVNIPKLKLVRSVDASDLLINVNFSFRDNATVIRKVVENTNMATAGQTTVSFKLDANYKLNEYLSAIFYYEQFINTPKVSLSYPTGNLKTGITLRFDLNGLK